MDLLHWEMKINSHYATHSGRLLVVPAIAANRTITLPSPVAGAHFKFIYGGAAEEAENLIFDTGANA
jgi:hypothetical protein